MVGALRDIAVLPPGAGLPNRCEYEADMVGVPLRFDNIDIAEPGLGLGLGGPSDSVKSESAGYAALPQCRLWA
jgi:hypothetical protein